MNKKSLFQKCRQGIIAILLATLVIVCVAFLVACSNSNTDSSSSKSSVIGQNFEFAGYTWRVLDTHEDQALIVTEYIIEVRRFDESSNDWSVSEIRQYLNGEFLNNFSVEDQQSIVDRNISDTGTTDKIFLLSSDEVYSYFSGPEDCSTKFIGTDMYTEIDPEMERWWWLRSPGTTGVGVALAGSDGVVEPEINNVQQVYYGMRPAMVVYLDAFQKSSSAENETPDSTEPQEQTETLEPQIPEGAIDWTEAHQHVGETVTIYGPVAGSTYASTSNGQPTFIDIGTSYPDTNRVSIVVWGEDRGNFSGSPKDMYLGKTICVIGEIYNYSGACNIKVASPSQIQVID